MIIASSRDTLLAHERFPRHALLLDSGENLRVPGQGRGRPRDMELELEPAPDLEEYDTSTEGTKASTETLCRKAKRDKGPELGMNRVNGVQWKCPRGITGRLLKILSV